MIAKYYNYLWRRVTMDEGDFDSQIYNSVVESFIRENRFKSSGADINDYPWLTMEKEIYESLSRSTATSPFHEKNINLTMIKSIITIKDYLKLNYFFLQNKDIALQFLQHKESNVSLPKVPSICGLHSVNNLHQIQHLAKYHKTIGRSFTSYSSYVEFGGGYGNFCRLIRCVDKNNTYTIVDLPALLGVQHWYLSLFFNKDDINICREKVSEGKINLISSNDFLAGRVLGIPDESNFISTWALSETPKEIQMNKFIQFTIKKARHLLLAYSKTQNELILPEGCYDVLLKCPDIIGIEGSHEYLFR